MGAVNERHKDRYPKFRVGGALNAAVFRGRPEEAKDAGYAQRCRCENPATYQDEDGERRCLCGRGVGP